MKMKVEVINRDCIKPSSPTPNHLRKHELSFLDQVAPPIFMPMLLFYPANTYADAPSLSVGHVKQSLSETLTRFYPLAGRVIDNAFVDCNDEGAPFVEARVNCVLNDVVSQPDPNQLNRFLPCELECVVDYVLAVQTNVFDCGGMAFGVCISHKVADAFALVMFLNSWASISRGDYNPNINPNNGNNFRAPVFDLATIFPPKSISGFKPGVGIARDKIVTRRFVFSASTVASLRAKYTTSSSATERRPTRIEALSAYIWSRYLASTQQRSPNSDVDIVYKVLHAVNLRTRVSPPLPEHHFGNICRFATATTAFDEDDEECYNFVGQMREAIREVDEEYVKRIQRGNEHVDYLKKRAEEFLKGDVVSFSFTSLCRFPLYETDFGWGRPTWVGSASLTFKNLVCFMDGCNGGIEAWVNLKEEEMGKFEEDEQLRALTCSARDAKYELISAIIVLFQVY